MSASEGQGRPGRRLFALLAALAALALITAGLVRLAMDARDRDPRPRGTLEDVLALRARSELNVLFILVDTLRADRLGVYGYERDTSPNLDALAATGIRFADQISQSSWTKCSMASLWTGLYPARARVLRSYDVVSEEARMPAEIFQEAGFRTAGIWRNGWIDPNFGFSQGFEIYLSPRSQRRQGKRLVRLENPNVTLDGDDADLLYSAFEFLRAHGHERWFLYQLDPLGRQPAGASVPRSGGARPAREHPRRVQLRPRRGLRGARRRGARAERLRRGDSDAADPELSLPAQAGRGGRGALGERGSVAHGAGAGGVACAARRGWALHAAGDRRRDAR
jgi:hypothetical protein